jgi:energy-converting hydrogenase A subunit P
LENINFLQTKDFFSLNALQCLRNEYLFNNCTLCFERCEHEALGLFKNKIKLFDELCTSCGVCVGVCPTQSLSLSNFDLTNFILTFCEKQNNRIIEKIDLPSFGMLDFHSLVSIVLRTKCNIFLEYAPTTSSATLDYIENQVQQSNIFLAAIGFEHSLFLQQQNNVIDTNRRSLFKTMFNATLELKQETTGSKKLNQHQKTVPSKLVLFKNSLKLVCEDINHTINVENFLLYNQKINFEACTNCIECITFCPTQALFQNSFKESIYFQSGKCIGCSICHDVCKHQAIQEDNQLDLIEFMFDKTEKLVEFKYITCHSCNNAFIHKNRGNICDICTDYTNNFNQMFTLAKDL